jgi:ABC-2 type transport system permease protein
MTGLRRYVRLYLHLYAQYAKARLSFRADFLISILGTVMWWVPSLLSIMVIFGKVPSVAGYSLEELLFLYGFYLLAMEPAGIFFGNVWRLGFQVRSGNFIKYYFRPINMMFYFMTESIDLISLWAIPAGIGLMVWSSARLGLHWTAMKIAGTLVLVGSASLIVCALMVAAASSAFWITNSHSLLQLASNFRENARYPMGIYDRAFRFVFSAVIPIGFVAFYPVQWILRPGEAGVAPFLTPLVGAASFAVAAFIWSMGVRRWNATGT